jgi:hypothetical protein
MGSQVINKKMNEKQTSAMIRSAATSTDIRKNKIMDEVCMAFYPVLSFYCSLTYWHWSFTFKF